MEDVIKSWEKNKEFSIGRHRDRYLQKRFFFFISIKLDKQGMAYSRSLQIKPHKEEKKGPNRAVELPSKAPFFSRR